MRPAYAASFVAALICHALLLFGFKLDIPARPLAPSDEPSPVDVTLVAAAPEPHPAAEPAPTPSLETAPAPEPPRETPSPRPREQKPQRTAPATLPGGTHPVATANGPISTVTRYRSVPKPEYPEEARRLRQEGLVLLSVEVSAEGRVTDVSVKRSSGFDLLDQAAIQAVKRTPFEPARVGPFPVASRVEVPIRFILPR